MRSVSVESEFNIGTFLNKDAVLNFSNNSQWYKVHDGSNGDIISGINKMN